MSILFSPIGESDPIRNLHDGPMLHILRHYTDIDYCFLFLTKSMESNYDNQIYQKAISTLNRNIKCNAEKSGIIIANDYDIFYEKFIAALKKIRNEYPDEIIYLNLSSGTPQMSATLALISCSSDINNLHALQVSRASEKDKRSASSIEKDYDFELELLLNEDNDNQINRCKEIRPIMIINNNIKERVKRLIDSYDYENAYDVYKNSPLYCKEIGEIIKHLKFRQNLDIDNAYKCIKNNSYASKLYLNFLTSTKREYVMLEYFLLLNNLLLSNKINDFIIRLCSYGLELQKEVIKYFFGYEFLNNILSQSKNEMNYQQIKTLDSKLYDELIKIYDNFPFYANMELLNIIIDFKIEENKIEKNSLFKETFNKIISLKKLRNDSAHQLKIVTLDDINKICHIKDLLKNIKQILQFIYSNISANYFDLYSNANFYIKKEMK